MQRVAQALCPHFQVVASIYIHKFLTDDVGSSSRLHRAASNLEAFSLRRYKGSRNHLRPKLSGSLLRVPPSPHPLSSPFSGITPELLTQTAHVFIPNQFKKRANCAICFDPITTFLKTHTYQHHCRICLLPVHELCLTAAQLTKCHGVSMSEKWWDAFISKRKQQHDRSDSPPPSTNGLDVFPIVSRPILARSDYEVAKQSWVKPRDNIKVSILFPADSVLSTISLPTLKLELSPMTVGKLQQDVVDRFALRVPSAHRISFREAVATYRLHEPDADRHLSRDEQLFGGKYKELVLGPRYIESIQTIAPSPPPVCCSPPPSPAPFPPSPAPLPSSPAPLPPVSPKPMDGSLVHFHQQEHAVDAHISKKR